MSFELTPGVIDCETHKRTDELTSDAVPTIVYVGKPVGISTESFANGAKTIAVLNGAVCESADARVAGGGDTIA